VTGHAEMVDRIVAIVNDDCIVLSELDEAVSPYAEQIRGADYPPEVQREMLFRLRQDLLNKMIDQKLTSQESEKLNVLVDDREVDKQIEQIKSQYLMTDEELRASLAKEGYTLEAYRDRIREQMLQMKLINIEIKSKIAITEKEIQNYYEAHKSDYKGAKRYHLYTIVIRIPEAATADERKRALEKAESIAKALKSGAAYDEVAKEHSESGITVAGGDLGLFTLDEIAPEFRGTISSMREGAASPVLQTPKGYQILILREIKEMPQKTLKEASIEIHEKLYQKFLEEKYTTWLEELRERSYVKIIL
jgi:peptidyl-prolyl cis-trans isomerase SurA